MTEQPPSRYRVVEKDRRLVVIDTWAEEGRPTSVTPPPRESGRSVNDLLGLDTKPAETKADISGSPFGRFEQTSFDGRGQFMTHPLYDAKGPRTIRMVQGSTAVMKGVKTAMGVVFAAMVLIFVFSPFALFPIAFVLFAARAKLRENITAWLDRLEQEAS